MDHHLDVDPVLDVVAVEQRNLPVRNHVLCVEGAHGRDVVVLDLHVHTGDVLRRGQLDAVRCVRLGRDELVRVDDLGRVAAVVHCGECLPHAQKRPGIGQRCPGKR